MTGIPKFPLGRLMSTPNALRKIPSDEMLTALQRHVQGDWGDVDEHDHQANEAALLNGSRLFSVYHARNRTKFWIITEADRSVTTVLLPEDY